MSQLEEAFAEQQQDYARGIKPVRALGFILVQKGFISNIQLVQLLKKQRERTMDPKNEARQRTLLGKIMVERKIVTEEQVRECLAEQAEALKNDDSIIPRIGELLVQRKYATLTAVSESLAAQAEARGADKKP